ncbi:MAG: polyhydroxyalkanoate synthesis regulator DNA-binding domain-containing protein [Planctomycetales bacterium]|nr:polyhydroxyalkanoate synthesis regulator DNA-binding domain-containing protein [Planctomycetales bacterium]
MTTTVSIARYPNRRLYDRDQKKYVTLGDVEAIVLSGRNVRVYDSKSEQDLTRLVLVQILLERHPERLQMFSTALLQELLRADQMTIDWLKVYFGQASSALTSATSAGATSYIPGFDIWRNFATGFANPTGQSQPPAQSPGSDVESPVELLEKVAELEKRLKKLEGEKET